MNRTGKNRLLKLANLLEQDAKNKQGVKFDLTAWAKKNTGTDLDPNMERYGFKKSDKGKIPVNCNTAACAWGLAAISGAFKRSGLSYRITFDSQLIPVFGKLEEFRAAQKFFDISSREADFLFDPCFYPIGRRRGSEAELFVSERIRNFVDGKEKIPDFAPY